METAQEAFARAARFIPYVILVCAILVALGVTFLASQNLLGPATAAATLAVDIGLAGSVLIFGNREI